MARLVVLAVVLIRHALAGAQERRESIGARGDERSPPDRRSDGALLGPEDVTPEWTHLEALVAADRCGDSFSAELLAGWPEPVQRYFSAAVAPGAPLAPATRLTMRGSIKVGRWSGSGPGSSSLHATAVAARHWSVLVGSRGRRAAHRRASSN